jgi:bifunctional isochorismate lyase/aryl carrier protein
VRIPKIEYYDAPARVDGWRAPLAWRVEPESAALLVHDMQNYFVNVYESSLFVDKLVRNIDAIRQRCHALGIPVFYTAQPGKQPKSTRGLLLDLWGPGMPEGEPQAIVPSLSPAAGRDEVLVKHRYSAFAKSDLLDRLRARGRNQLLICGVYAHIGCQVTATDAFMADIKPFFVSDALGDFSRDHHKRALHYVAHCSGRVLSTAQTLSELE